MTPAVLDIRDNHTQPYERSLTLSRGCTRTSRSLQDREREPPGTPATPASKAMSTEELLRPAQSAHAKGTASAAPLGSRGRGKAPAHTDHRGKGGKGGKGKGAKGKPSSQQQPQHHQQPQQQQQRPPVQPTMPPAQGGAPPVHPGTPPVPPEPPPGPPPQEEAPKEWRHFRVAAKSKKENKVAVSETDIITEMAVILSSPELPITIENVHNYVRAGNMSRFGPWNLIINKTIAAPLAEIEETELDFLDPETNDLRSVEVTIDETHRITGRTLVDESERVARIARNSIERNKAVDARKFMLHYALSGSLVELDSETPLASAYKQLKTLIQLACPAGFIVGKPGRSKNNHGNLSARVYVHVVPTAEFAAWYPEEQDGAAASSGGESDEDCPIIQWHAFRRFTPIDSQGKPISTFWDGSISGQGRRYLKGVPNCCWSPACDGTDCEAKAKAVLNSAAGARPSRQDNVARWEQAEKRQQLDQRRKKAKIDFDNANCVEAEDDGLGPTHDARGRILCRTYRMGKCWRDWASPRGCLKAHGTPAEALERDCASVTRDMHCGGTSAVPCPYRHGPPLAHANSVIYSKGDLSIKAVITGTTPQPIGEPTYVIAFQGENGEAIYREVERISLTLATNEGAGSSASAPMET
jgi:hypothetical protein